MYRLVKIFKQKVWLLMSKSDKIKEHIEEYNLTYCRELEEREIYIRNLSDEKFYQCLRDFGRTVVNGKSKASTHFLNNRWYNRKQRTSDNYEIQLRDALINELKRKNVLNDSTLNTFEKIYSIIEEIISDLNKIGIIGASQMTKYDISKFIGARKNISPRDIYIHRGVRSGAFYLGIIRKENFDTILKKNEILILCPALDNLGESKHIENFLCLYKKQLEELFK